jgi:hypothetical protein
VSRASSRSEARAEAAGVGSSARLGPKRPRRCLGMAHSQTPPGPGPVSSPPGGCWALPRANTLAHRGRPPPRRPARCSRPTRPAPTETHRPAPAAAPLPWRTALARPARTPGATAHPYTGPDARSGTPGDAWYGGPAVARPQGEAGAPDALQVPGDRTVRRHEVGWHGLMPSQRGPRPAVRERCASASPPTPAPHDRTATRTTRAQRHTGGGGHGHARVGASSAGRRPAEAAPPAARGALRVSVSRRHGRVGHRPLAPPAWRRWQARPPGAQSAHTAFRHPEDAGPSAPPPAY